MALMTHTEKNDYCVCTALFSFRNSIAILGIQGLLLPLFILLLGCNSKPPSFPKDTVSKEEIPPLERSLVIDAAQKEQLEALGYTAASQPAPQAGNVTIYDPTRTYNGLNLYASWHAPEAILMDMRGTVLHRWRYEMERVWPAAASSAEIDHPDFWRRVYPLPNGDLLAIYEGFGMIRIDRDSNLVWSYPGKCHHDLSVTPEGSIYTLTREAKHIPRIHPTELVVEDSVAVLDLQGRERWRLSILECLENSEYATLLEALPSRQGDIFHTNTIKVFDGSRERLSPYYKKGNLLISILHLDAIAIIDPLQKKAVWALAGLWDAQHEPTLLPGGSMLILDNLGNNGKSRILEFHPFTREILWEYKGEAGKPFYTMGCGSCLRLPNGNTLITETDFGRAFEASPAKEIVWEFINPHRSGANGELIAKIAEMIRLDESYAKDWLPRK